MGKPSLMEFLVSTEVSPRVELDLDRSRDTEARNTGDFNGTGVSVVNPFA